MPTLLEYLGLEAPQNMVGKSLMAALDGSESPELPTRFVVETEFRRSNVIGVYTPRWEYFEHRAPHAGTDPRELQKRGGGERGTTSNQLASNSEVGDALRAFLQQWERTHPKAKQTKRATPLPALEAEQLRALGYLD